MSKGDEHQRRSSSASNSSLFHSLKKSMFSSESEKTVDPAFESARTDFYRLNDWIHKIKKATAEYQQSMKALFGSSKCVADSYHDALEDAKPNPYALMLNEMKRTRTDVASERGEGTVTLHLEATAHRKLLDELELHRALIVRIGDREKVRAEMDYYNKKVEELRQDREKRAAKLKPERESDIDKFARNDAKYNQMRSTYQTLNAALIADLVDRWNARVRTLGPALADFLQVEKQVLVLYASAVKDIPAAGSTAGGGGAGAALANGFDDLSARAEQAKREATKQADAYASAAAAQAAQAQEKLQAQMSGGNGALLGFAAGSAASSASATLQAQQRAAQEKAAAAQAQAQAQALAAQARLDAAREAHAPAFEDFAMHSQASASDIFAKAKGISPQAQAQAQAAQAQAQAQAQAAQSAWDQQPPMLSHIASSGMGVGAAIGFSNMNTDGSSSAAAAAAQAASPRSAAAAPSPRPSPPLPPPPAPSQPAFYGSPQPVSPPGGPSAGGGGGPFAPPPPPPVPVARPSVGSGREGEANNYNPSMNPFAD